MNFYSHIFSSHFMIFRSFDIPKECIWCPNQLRCISRHVERRGEIMRESRISPPLTEENVHRIFLENDKKEINISQYTSKTRWVKLKFGGSWCCTSNLRDYTYNYNFTVFCRFATKIRYFTFVHYFATLFSNLVIRSSSNSPQILQKYRTLRLQRLFTSCDVFWMQCFIRVFTRSCSWLPQICRKMRKHFEFSLLTITYI